MANCSLGFHLRNEQGLANPLLATYLVNCRQDYIAKRNLGNTLLTDFWTYPERDGPVFGPTARWHYIHEKDEMRVRPPPGTERSS